eukprot:g2293.t1
MMRLRLTFENNAVYVNTSTKMKMRAVVSGLKPRHFDVVCEASRWRIVKEKTKEYMEIDSRNIVIQEQRKKELSFDNVVSISDLESASRHKPRDWDCTLRGRVVSVGGRRLAKSASNSFILELTDKNLISSVRVVFQGTSFMRYYSCLRYGDVVMISHLRRKQIRFRGENEFDFRIMAATPKKTCIYIVKSDKSMVSSTAKLSESNTIPSRKTVTITGWIGDIHGNGQFSILSEEPSNLDDHHFDLSPRDPEFRVYITGSTAVPFEGLGFRKGTKVRLCHVHPIYDAAQVSNSSVHGFAFCEKSSIQLLELSMTSSTSTSTCSPVILQTQWRQITRSLPVVVIPWAMRHMFPVLETKFGRTKTWKKDFVRNLSIMIGIRTRNVDRRRVFLDHEGSQCKGSIHWFENKFRDYKACSPCSYDEDESETRFPLGQLPRILTVREMLNACANLLHTTSNNDQVQSIDHNVLKTQLGASWLLILGHVQVMSSSSSPTLSLCDRTGAIRVVIPNMASPACLKDHVITAFSEFKILAERFGGKTRYSLIVSRSSPSCLFSFFPLKNTTLDDDGKCYSVIQRVNDGFDIVLNGTTSIARLYVNTSARLTMQPGQMYLSRCLRKVKENTYRLEDDEDLPCLVRTLHIADALQQQKEGYSVRGVLVSRQILRSKRVIYLRLCDERCPQLFSHHQSIVSSELTKKFMMTLRISIDRDVLPVASGVLGMTLEISGELIYDSNSYRLGKNSCICVVDSKYVALPFSSRDEEENASWAANVLSVVRSSSTTSSSRRRIMTLSQLYQIPLSRTNRKNPVRVNLSVLNIECLDVVWPCVLCGCANLNFQCKHPENDCLNVPWRSCRCQPANGMFGRDGEGIGFHANHRVSRCRWYGVFHVDDGTSQGR